MNPEATPDLTATELERYSRHLSLPEVGPQGQARLREARVLVVGLGGLGTPVALYLAAAGVGRLDLVEYDTVAASNLPRQILYDEDQKGQSKLRAALRRLRAQNPHVRVEGHDAVFDQLSAERLLPGHDLVVDATDNFATRYLLHDRAHQLGLPSVFGSLYRFEGQVSTFVPGQGPCFRCAFPVAPRLAPSCATGGVLGPLPGLVGTMQALEAMKILLGLGEPLVGRLLLVDALRMSFETLRIARDPECPCCGPQAATHRAGLPDQPVSGERDLELSWAELGREEQWLFLDVRDPLPAGLALPGTEHLPFSQLADRLAALPGDRPILAICQYGDLSRQAASVLRGAGFERAYSLAGGVRAWEGGQR